MSLQDGDVPQSYKEEHIEEYMREYIKETIVSLASQNPSILVILFRLHI